MSIERLKELIHELKCIQYSKEKKFELASGEVSDYKIVCDELFKNEEAREILGEIGYRMLRDIESKKTYEIVGVMTGGYEFAKIVAERAGRDLIIVDPHNNEIKGTIRKINICYFEDVVTKGGSVLKCQNIIRSCVPVIVDEKTISIVDREENGIENLVKNKIELKYILTKSDLGIN